MKQMIKKLFFPVIGLVSLIWFLIRVIPKPSRATYPCMRAAAPIASSFVIYLLGLFSSLVLFKKAKKFLYESRYILFSLTIILGMILGVSSYLQKNKKAYATYQSTLEGPNQPMGTGKGIFPGRVVWIYNPDATDENCKNSINDYWWQDENTDQDVVNTMFSDGIKKLTNKQTDTEAWDALFRYYNNTHGKGDVGYTAGEKIVIKINLNGQNNGFQDRNINTSPQIAYTVLNHLINIVGVAQADIGIGDPGTSMGNIHWDKCHTAFPNVQYWGTRNGRTPAVKSQNDQLFASDGGKQNALPQCYLDAAYMINIPVFKKHHRAGISICCKNHFGSVSAYNSNGAFDWHYSLPCPDGGADNSNGEYGVYRCFVDIMGHKDLGGKTILYLVDGLWSSYNWGHPPIKWRMTPFNNDWPNSLFFSQDPIAIESVCFDFLFYEFDENHPTEGSYDPSDNHGPFPHYLGVDDYLHQAADSLNWAAGITYDPENDGTALPRSMGTHEHWDNATDKQYSQNLGLDQGIELVSNLNPTGIVDGNRDLNPLVKDFTLNQNYPNPFNLTTTIGFDLPVPARVALGIYNVQGQKIRTVVDELMEAGRHTQRWDGLMDNGFPAPSGVYFYKVVTQDNDHAFQQVKKMILCK